MFHLTHLDAFVDPEIEASSRILTFFELATKGYIIVLDLEARSTKNPLFISIFPLSDSNRAGTARIFIKKNPVVCALSRIPKSDKITLLMPILFKYSFKLRIHELF